LIASEAKKKLGNALFSHTISAYQAIKHALILLRNFGSNQLWEQWIISSGKHLLLEEPELSWDKIEVLDAPQNHHH